MHFCQKNIEVNLQQDENFIHTSESSHSTNDLNSPSKKFSENQSKNNIHVPIPKYPKSYQRNNTTDNYFYNLFVQQTMNQLYDNYLKNQEKESSDTLITEKNSLQNSMNSFESETRCFRKPQVCLKKIPSDESSQRQSESQENTQKMNSILQSVFPNFPQISTQSLKKINQQKPQCEKENINSNIQKEKENITSDETPVVYTESQKLEKKLLRRQKIERYLEKKKRRRWDVLRYEVRKKIAKTRLRVKGRFVKDGEVEENSPSCDKNNDTAIEI